MWAISSGLAPSPAAWAEAPSDRPPNFVIVLTDDLGLGDLGSYGQQLIHTPRLDAMAAGGLRLTRLYAGDAWCPVTRESLLTGRHGGHTAIRNGSVVPEDSEGAPRYLPRHLALAGYATALFGKWGLGAYDPLPDPAVAMGGRPSAVGFQEFLGAMTHRDAHAHQLPPFPQQPGDIPIHDRLWTIEEGETVEDAQAVVPFVQDKVMVAALDFVTRHQDQPFLLYLPFDTPHAEYFLPLDDPAWLPYLEEGSSIFPETPFPGNALMRRPVPAPKATYAALVSRIDRDVGRLLDHLETLGLADHTLVVFASDNGPPTDAPYNNPEFFGSAAGLRGFKFGLLEGGLRVPGLLYWPGRIEPGRVSAEPLGLWDLFPTLLELAGVAVPAGTDGVSLLPLLDGLPPTAHDAAHPLYWETWNGSFNGQATRQGDLKLIRTGVADPEGPFALYDLGLDPREEHDLSGYAARCPQVLALIDALNAARQPPPGGGFAVTPLTAACPTWGLFADGFESGDTGRWFSTSP